MNGNLQNKEWPEVEPELSKVLGNFRASVKAWSKAAASEPRSVKPLARQFGWRLALSATMGCLLAALLLTVAVARYRERVPAESSVVRESASQAAPRERQVAFAPQAASEERNAQLAAAARDLMAVEGLLAREEEQTSPTDGEVKTDDDLLVAVRNDVARQVPSAMEPLAQLAAANAAE